MGASSEPPWQAFGAEFFRAIPLASVAVFGVNNFVLKTHWPGWISGKLSDVTACFFMPLFISACLDALSLRRLRLRVRLGAGALITTLLLAVMKLSVDGSRAITATLNQINANLGLPLTSNVPDPTDLVALPLAAVAVLFGLRQGR